MHWACARGSRDACESLLRAGTSPTIPTKSGWTPMHVAALNGRAELLDALIAPDPQDARRHRAHRRAERPNTEQRTHRASPGGANAKLGAIETLANAGADPEARDTDGLRPADVTLNAGVRSLLGARTVGGGVGVGGTKVAATVTAAVAAARFKKGGGGGGGGGGDLTAGDRVTGGDGRRGHNPPGPTPPPPGAPRSGAPRPPTGSSSSSVASPSSVVVSSVAEGIGALKVEEDVDFQERVRDELRRNRERVKGPLGTAPAHRGERGVHPRAGRTRNSSASTGWRTRGTSSRRE